MRKAWSLVLSLAFVGVFVACGDGDLGESCDEEGLVAGECDEGLVCGKKQNSSNDLTCLKQCSSPAECSGEEDCTGVGNSSLKACRPRQQL